MSNVVPINQLNIFQEANSEECPEGAVTIGDHFLRFREYNGVRVLNFELIDSLHQRPEGTAKRNFSCNRKHFVRGVDYFYFNGKEGRKALQDANCTNFVQLKSSNNFSMYLFTQSGYCLLVKSFTDDLAWQIQRELINGYFKVKEVLSSNNIYDLMRKMIDTLEEHQHSQDATNAQLSAMSNQVEQINHKMEFAIDPSWQPPYAVAKLLGVYSSFSKKPHSELVTAIAKQLGYRIGIRNYYNEDDRFAITACQKDTKFAWEIYFKPKGIDEIVGWWEQNQEKAQFVERYKRKAGVHNVGDVKDVGFIIGGKKYHVNKL